MFPSLLKLNESPPMLEKVGIRIDAPKTVSIRDSGLLPLYGVLRAGRDHIKGLIESMILVVCYGEAHVPYTDHIFKEVIVLEDDIIPFGGDDVIFYFNIDALQVCYLKPTCGTYYLNVSTQTIQSNVVKVLVNI